MTQVSYQGGQYTETVDIKGVITLTPYSNIKEKLTNLRLHTSIVLRFKGDNTRKHMFVKNSNGNFIWLYKLPYDKSFLLNCNSVKDMDNISIQELSSIVNFNMLEVDEV